MDCFITGTDTGAGKTQVTCALLDLLAGLGVHAGAMKPLAAGLDFRDGLYVNEDVARLKSHAVAELPAKVMNPYSFSAPTAPHIAAALELRRVELQVLTQAVLEAKALTEVLLVEGVGGWSLPLNDTEMLADFVRAAGLPVIMVAGIRLGALNHSLLTARAIVADGCTLIGWVANIVDPAYAYADGTIETLRQKIPAPCLAVVPWHALESVATTPPGLAELAARLAGPR